MAPWPHLQAALPDTRQVRGRTLTTSRDSKADYDSSRMGSSSADDLTRFLHWRLAVIGGDAEPEHAYTSSIPPEVEIKAQRDKDSVASLPS